jgi:hypothetical protein
VSTLAFHFSLLAVNELVLQEKENYVHKLKEVAAVNARRTVPARSKAAIDATSQALSLPSARRPASPPSRHFCHNILVLAAVFADG